MVLRIRRCEEIENIRWVRNLPQEIITETAISEVYRDAVKLELQSGLEANACSLESGNAALSQRLAPPSTAGNILF